MEKIEKNLKEEARKLLEGKQVDVLIGYEMGTLPLTATPCFISSPDEVDRLVWNALCVHNLAKYVHDVIAQHKKAQKRVKPEDRKKKVVGVVAKGCTSRSIVLHLQERQYTRDEVIILGVPCTGYIDKRKLDRALDGQELREGSLNEDYVLVYTKAGEKRLVLKELLADNCITCPFNNPVIYDVMLGEKAVPMNVESEYFLVDEFAKRSTEDRWAYFTKEMAKCIRCYACRQACPSCYCPTCFVEQSQPYWVGISDDPSDTQVFQIMRLFHMVGRCVDCGSCVSVCPMGVDLRTFLKKLDKDVFELFGSRAGSSMDDLPPLSQFSEHDYGDFIFNP
ncbi:MAG: 4Fe-4S dicluster domain-containing protein [Syntrophales bacterium]|nr:4Fe-4S dicluster domain-containing protein [Syntrophales bacterium]